ncbi:MAG: TonB-dependent receptor [Gammaproteobacteria bacterium]|nr:TonB-dependent receptor [Gammaproteobacteria bacterium]
MPATQPRRLSTLEKALEINLDSGHYGTFAEIGAGQEVVRWFFQAGGAAGTISKSISAYDMQVSDAIYGESDRYVSRQRLESMLEYEQQLNRERLMASRGDEAAFFTFADTVAARNYHGTNECHGWMGMRFQAEPNAADSTVIIHVRMLDDNNAAQQEAIGIIGVNLIHSAYTLHQDPRALLQSLTDNLSARRVEIDMIDVAGPAFKGVDNRVLTLRLVQLELTDAAMFAADGRVLQPSEALRKKPLLVQRGRFRPVTHVNMDMLQASLNKFAEVNGMPVADVLPILEISMQNLKDDSDVCLEDFVSRAEVAAATGCTVMISDFRQYHRLAAYLARYTNAPIGLPLGLTTLRSLFDARYYDDLDGGILEGLGRLFRQQLCLYIYPCKNDDSAVVEHIEDVQLEGPLQHLFDYLRERGCLVPLMDVAYHHLDIHSPNVLQMIASGDAGWTRMVPDAVAEKIVAGSLFGHRGQAQTDS